MVLSKKEIINIIDEHQKWLADKSTGKQADFYNAELDCQKDVDIFLGKDLSEAIFAGAKITNVIFKKTTLNKINFFNVTLENVSFVDCELNQDNFSNSTFSNVFLGGKETFLKDVAFQEVKFSDFRTKRASFNHCSFLDSCFSKAKFTDLRMISSRFRKVVLNNVEIVNGRILSTTFDFITSTNVVMKDCSLGSNDFSNWDLSQIILHRPRFTAGNKFVNKIALLTLMSEKGRSYNFVCYPEQNLFQFEYHKKPCPKDELLKTLHEYGFKETDINSFNRLLDVV